MSDRGSDHETNTGPMSSSGERDLATKVLMIQHKRFYLDVKENRRGKYFKVAEVGNAGRKSRLFLTMSTAAEFKKHLNTFIEVYAKLGPPNPDSLPENGKIKSETIVKDNRKYYLDLKENNRGRFLRVSQTVTRGTQRSQIAIPAQGMIEFKDALTDLLDEYGVSDGGGDDEKLSSFKGDLPEGKNLRLGNKIFYFDVGQNDLGIYMRISEVRNNFRSTITIPDKSWAQFRDVLSDYVGKMNVASDEKIQGGGNVSGGSGSQTGDGGMVMASPNSGGGGSVSSVPSK